MSQWNKYGLTAAREHGTPGRDARPRSTTVDIHSHVAIPEAIAFVKPHLDISTVPLAHFADAQTKALSQKQEEDVRARITGYDERLADLDGMGIDLQLVMPPPNQCYYTVPLDIAVKAAHIATDERTHVTGQIGIDGGFKHGGDELALRDSGLRIIKRARARGLPNAPQAGRKPLVA